MRVKKKPPLKLNIKESVISIIASGNSVSKLTNNDINYISSNTYTVGFNYSPCKFKNLNQVFYIDNRVKNYLDTIKGDLIKLTRCDDEISEAEAVVHRLRLIEANKQLRWGEICILYRTNAQSRVIEESLVRWSIPYIVVGGLRFYVTYSDDYIKGAIQMAEQLSRNITE